MEPPSTSRMNAGFVVFCAAVTGIGGFLFGYDTAVINGANTFLQQHFRLNPKEDALWIGLATAAAIIGCIPGAMSAGFISDKFGRRRVLFFCAILFAASGILSAIPQSFSQFIAARLLSGIAIGVSSMICPVYIAEIAPPQWRGRLGTLFQLGIVSGIFITLFINGEIQSLGNHDWNVRLGWRWMLAAEALPALAFIGLLLPIPESPRWLISAGRVAEARRTLERIGGKSYADVEISAVDEVLKQERGTLSELFAPAWRLPLVIAVVLMLGSQLSGINAIMYYSTDIFLKAAGTQTAFACTVWIGLVNFLATFIAIFFVDKMGRRPLLLIGNAIQVAALVAVGWLYHTNSESAGLLLGFIIFYIAAFAMAMGPLPWVVCSEIFPSKLRGRAMSFATLCIWSGCLAVALLFPLLLRHLGAAATFWVFAACSAATFLFVLRFLPETKGRSLEEIERSWQPHDRQAV